MAYDMADITLEQRLGMAIGALQSDAYSQFMASESFKRRIDPHDQANLALTFVAPLSFAETHLVEGTKEPDSVLDELLERTRMIWGGKRAAPDKRETLDAIAGFISSKSGLDLRPGVTLDTHTIMAMEDWWESDQGGHQLVRKTLGIDRPNLYYARKHNSPDVEVFQIEELIAQKLIFMSTIAQLGEVPTFERLHAELEDLYHSIQPLAAANKMDGATQHVHITGSDAEVRAARRMVRVATRALDEKFDCSGKICFDSNLSRDLQEKFNRFEATGTVDWASHKSATFEAFDEIMGKIEHDGWLPNFSQQGRELFYAHARAFAKGYREVHCEHQVSAALRVDYSHKRIPECDAMFLEKAYGNMKGCDGGVNYQAAVDLLFTKLMQNLEQPSKRVANEAQHEGMLKEPALSEQISR